MENRSPFFFQPQHPMTRNRPISEGTSEMVRGGLRLARCPVKIADIYTTKIDGVVCPPNISETVAGRLMKLAHRPRIASKMIKLISKPILLPILLILVKTIQRIVADPKRKLSPPFDSADSVPSLGHAAPGSGKMLSLFTVLCDYSV